MSQLVSDLKAFLIQCLKKLIISTLLRDKKKLTIKKYKHEVQKDIKIKKFI